MADCFLKFTTHIPMQEHLGQSLTESVRRRFDHVIDVVELTVLILIGLATAFAMGQETWKVLKLGRVSLTDLS